MADDSQVIDSEEQMLIDLEAEEAANEAEQHPEAEPAAGEDTTGGAAEAEPAAAVEEPQPEPAAAATDEIRIPKPRLDAVLARNRELELENARLAGIAEGVKQGAAAKPATAAEPEVKTDPAADRLIAIETEKDDLYAKVDAGEMTFVDLRAAERKLNAEAAQLRDVITDRKRQPAPEPQAADVNGDLRLNEMTTQLAVDNEWIGDIPPEYLVNSVMPLAEQLLIKRGHPITKDPAGAFRMRAMTVEVAKAMEAFRLFSPRERWPAEAGAQAAPAAAPAQPANGKARIPTAHLTPAQVRERMADKRDLAARQPPELVAAGTRLPGEMTSAKDVESMSEDELAELTEAEQERLAPSRAR